MPTNLPPEFYEAEQLYKQAESTTEKIARLEDMISTIPKHKGTDKLRAGYRRRLSKLKASAQTQKKTGVSHSAYQIDKEGAGRVVMVGPTNVGKSALMQALTNASPEVGDAPFTTWSPTPGMIRIDNVQVQLIDTPPIDSDFIAPLFFEMIRHSDVILLVVDVQTYPVEQLEETVAALVENNILPLGWKDQVDSQILKVFIPFIVLANKCDDKSCQGVFEVFCELLEEEWTLLPVSGATGHNLDQLKKMIFDLLGIIRIFSKPPGKEPDLSAPFVMGEGSTITEFAAKIHKDFSMNKASAKVWGSSVFDGQMVGKDHVLQDGDVVELRM